jgi:hypothetical protein
MDTDFDEQAEAEAEAARQAQVMAAMREAGVSTEEHIQVDYFGFEETHRVVLQDGKSWIEHQTLNEGARRNYMNKVNREVRLQKSGDAFMKMATGDERHALLESAICGWNLVRADKTGVVKPISFSPQALREFLQKAPPGIVDLIEKDIRDKNPWLVGDVTIEDIDEQIAELNELREKKVLEAEGKES